MRTEINYAELKLDKESPEPLHLQLSRELHRQIRLLLPNSQANLLSERKLSDLLALDRSTTHRAYSELKKAGLLSQGPNKTLCVAADARQKTRRPFPNIGIIIPERFSDFIDHSQQIPMLYMRGIFDRAAELNISTLMVQLPPYDADENHIRDFLSTVIGRLNGVIHLGHRKSPEDAPLQRLFEYTEVPQIFISGYPEYPHIGSVCGDVGTGARSLCEQLREMGHKDVGIISFFHDAFAKTWNSIFRYESCDRAKNLLDYFNMYGFNCREDWQLYGCDGKEQIKRGLRKLDCLPTVFWCIDDEIARMTIEALTELGVRVPEDVSVVGFDGETMAGKYDGLTTVKLPFYAIGSKSVDLLHEYYENGISDDNRMIRLPTSLILRNSLAQASRKPALSIYKSKSHKENLQTTGV